MNPVYSPGFAPTRGGTLAGRFWARVDKSEPAGCWTWIGAKSRLGYGFFYPLGKRVRRQFAHRVSYEIHIGAIPEGLRILHRCDNPPCVRPDHLFLGTQADNVADMVGKGRQGWALHEGERNPRARLTAADVLELRRLFAEGRDLSRRFARGTHTLRALARRFGVHKGTASLAIYGRNWKHLR